ANTHARRSAWGPCRSASRSRSRPSSRRTDVTDVGWLVARPIAHRGFHDRANGRLENTLSAARAAVDRNFAIECDVQLSADEVPVVFHDDNLDRLTVTTGPLRQRTLAELKAIP